MNAVVVLQHGLQRHFIWQWLCCFCLAAASFGVVYAADPDLQKSDAEAAPLILDLSQFYLQPNATLPFFKTFIGRQVIDGMPFQIEGHVRLYGKTSEINRDKVYPSTKKGIRVGRKFDDLYLIHHAFWPDVEGQTVAYICLNYADGTEYIFPIRYGFHVRDWFNLPSYEKESMADPDTTICWRGSPVFYNAPVRIFKSKLVNPSPEIVVETMDIISARNLAAYNLIAATATNRRSADTARFVGDREFDGKIVVRVVDNITGKPITGALVLPGMRFLDQDVVGSPFYTSATGEGTIPYPIKGTSDFFASVMSKGYQCRRQYWQSPVPDTYIFRLTPIAAD